MEASDYDYAKILTQVPHEQKQRNMMKRGTQTYGKVMNCFV